MAQREHCDGCDQPLPTPIEGGPPPKPFETIGVVIPRDYCADCAVVAKEYITARDAVHATVAGLWQSGALGVYHQFRVQLPNGKLPDERS